MPAVVVPEHVEATIASFTRLDQKGDKKAMGKLAQRLQREQPFLLQYAATMRADHGDTVGEAAVFYVTLVWAMFDRSWEATLPRVVQQNIADAEAVVTGALGSVEGLETKPVHERYSPRLAQTQPNIYAKLVELIEEDVKEKAMAEETAALIFRPTQIAIEAFDAALDGRRPGERQGTIKHQEAPPGRNEPCPCGSGKKYKKCHGAAAS